MRSENEHKLGEDGVMHRVKKKKKMYIYVLYMQEEIYKKFPVLKLFKLFLQD